MAYWWTLSCVTGKITLKLTSAPYFFHSDNVTTIGLFSAKTTELQVQKKKLRSILHRFHQILQFHLRCLQIYHRSLPFHPCLLHFHPRCLPLMLFQSRERKGRNSRLLIKSSKSNRSGKQRGHEADIVPWTKRRFWCYSLKKVFIEWIKMLLWIMKHNVLFVIKL